MTTREMVMNLMAECVEDATDAVRRVVLAMEAETVTPDAFVNATATLAAAMFEARWTAGTAKLLEEVKRQ